MMNNNLYTPPKNSPYGNKNFRPNTISGGFNGPNSAKKYKQTPSTSLNFNRRRSAGYSRNKNTYLIDNNTGDFKPPTNSITDLSYNLGGFLGDDRESNFDNENIIRKPNEFNQNKRQTNYFNNNNYNDEEEDDNNNYNIGNKVTIFGFDSRHKENIINIFERCGTIVDTSYPKQSSNFIHITYQSNFGAETAMTKNGTLFGPNLIIGVLPYKPSNNQFSNGNDYSKIKKRNRFGPSEILVDVGKRPIQRRSLWNKILEYVFGW
eukprot:TRINITY_DN6534_c0_g1_i1.p1 TRINITY_DN6534_c0_g1~~TRINITY_DN6534_c0_g1_i1.p1  ORF type:complete len:263 (-),score=81.51 TRINITY_DN6534_c0_g1_i1:229-1017(-)